MDKSWIPNGRPFSPTFIAGVEDFMDTVEQRYPGQNIPCPCTHCLNQVVKSLDQVKEDLLVHRMSPTYTTWIHHGEEGGGTDIIESSDVHGSHHHGWIEEEEEQEDRNYNILPDFDEIVQNMLASKERAGRALMFDRVLDELKQSVCSESTFSRFFFLVRLLYLKFHYRVSNSYFDAQLMLLSDAFPSSNVPKSCEEARKYIRDLG
jgi:hypothetical protein